MSDYHKYVFNVDKREFVGAFEEMYQQESKDNFDSWLQEDSRKLNRKIVIAILDEWNFQTVIDVGSGKGALTHLLKKRNNQVIGLDISPTAVEQAKVRFPDIEFESIDVNNSYLWNQYLYRKHESWGGVDLVFTSECLSYLENWREFLQAISRYSKFVMINLYIPDNPIGFVKSPTELEDEVEKYFEVLESVHLTQTNFIVLFAKSNAV